MANGNLKFVEWCGRGETHIPYKGINKPEEQNKKRDIKIKAF